MPEKRAKTDNPSAEPDITGKAGEAVHTAIEVVHFNQIAGIVGDTDKMNQAAVNQVDAGHATSAGLHTVVEHVNQSVHFLDKIAHVLHPLGVLLHAAGAFFPPLRALLVGINALFTLARSFADEKLSNASKAQKIALALIALGVFIAILILPALTITLFIAAAAAGLVSDIIDLGKAIFQEVKINKQLQEQQRLQKLLELKSQIMAAKPEDRQKNLLGYTQALHTIKNSEKAPLHQQNQIPDHKALLKEIDAEINATAKKMNFSLSGSDAAAVKSDLTRINTQITQTQTDLATAQKQRNDKIAAVVCGTVGLVGVILLLTPLAPIGIALLVASSVGIIGYKAAPTVARWAKAAGSKIAAWFNKPPQKSGNRLEQTERQSLNNAMADSALQHVDSTAHILQREHHDKGFSKPEIDELEQQLKHNLSQPDTVPEAPHKSDVIQNNGEKSLQEEEESDGRSEGESDQKPTLFH